MSVGCRARKDGPTVDNKDIGVASGSTRHVQEVYMILGNRHDRLVGVTIRRFFDVCPRNRRRIGGSQGTHVKEEEFSFRKRIEDIGVVIEDGSE